MSDDIKRFPEAPTSCNLESDYILPSSRLDSQHHSSTTVKLKPVNQVIFLLFGLLGIFAMTSIFQRLTRPFTSSTMHFTPEQAAQKLSIPEGAELATVANGCFWGTEHMFRKDFTNKGLIDAQVGYIGGDTQSPTYRAVCSGRTGREFSWHSGTKRP